MLHHRALDEERPPPVTLPRIVLPTIDEAEEIAARFREQRTVRAGIESWQAIGRANGFEAWKTIGAALAVGKAHALRVTGANQAWGRNYSRAFCEWIEAHRFEKMAPSVRSVAIDLHENVGAIEQWRSTLNEKDRRRLVHPLSNVRRWRQSLMQKPKPDAVKAAEIAWRRFVACVEALPREQAASFWQSVHVQTAVHLAG